MTAGHPIADAALDDRVLGKTGVSKTSDVRGAAAAPPFPIRSACGGGLRLMADGKNPLPARDRHCRGPHAKRVW
jgi:hypothetical protein